MASQQFANVSMNALGLELQGLAFNPNLLVFPSTFVAVDGLGLQTGGLAWNLAQGWIPAFPVQNVVWTGCSTCSTSCG